MGARFGILVTVAFLASALPATAATLLSDNFNNENGGQEQLNYRGFSNFNVTSGDVDLIGGQGQRYDFVPGNGLYIDLDGDQAGTLTTKVSFGPGNYTVSFSLAGKNTGSQDPASVKVTLGGFNMVFTLPTSQGFTTETFSTDVSTTSMLSFASLTPGVSGLLLDNVSVSTNDATVPEPATFALLGAGLVGLAVRRKRAS